jgi:hypothetical protein
VVEIVPINAGSTLQVTAAFVVLATVAINRCVAPKKTEAVAGEMLTLTGGGSAADVVVDSPPPLPLRIP